MMESAILKKEEQAVFALRQLYGRYGYVPYKMSRFEEYDLYVRNRDFLVSDQIITFADRSGKLLALKPDVTLSIIKNAPDRAGQVQKVYYNENVYRGAGHAVKEIMQAGLECVGDLGSYEIAEVVLLAVKSLALLGDKYVLDISHMGLVAAMLEELPEKAKEKAMVCLRQKNEHELRQLCLEAGVAPEKLTMLTTCRGSARQVLAQVESVLTTQAEREALEELNCLCRILSECGYAQQIRVDFSVGSPLKYYSGVVFRGYLEGVHTSVLSGGQYDKLLRRMGRTSGAIGFAIYLDLLEGRMGQLPPIDTLILHDGSADTAKVFAAAQQAAQFGTVLVATREPENREWKTLVDLREGARK